METKEYLAEYTYDYELDVVNIEVNQDSHHKETIELEFGVFLDFNEDDFPINLEIISASKILNLEKESLLNPHGNVTVVIGKDIIEVNACFKFNEDSEIVQFKVLNDFSFSTSEVNLALA